MPLIFWATQTMAASDLLGVGKCSSTFTPYNEWPTRLLLAQVRLEYNMTCAMWALPDSNYFVYSVCDYDWIIAVDPG